MKNFLIVIALALGAAASVAQAQSDDTKAILDAIGGLNSRLDKMQGEIDALKPSSPSTPIAPAEQEPQNSQQNEVEAASQGIPSGMQASPGWIINVLPVDERNREPDALFRFRQPKMPINFKSHLATRKIDDYVKYRAEALLNIEHAGRYVFSFEATAPRDRAFCAGYMRIGKSTVIDWGREFDHKRGALRIEARESATASGAITLEQGNYDVVLLIACWDVGGFSSYSSVKERWRDIKADVQVRGPHDDVLRPFAAKELFHWVKAPERQGSSSGAVAGSVSTAALRIAAPSKGTIKTLTSTINVRTMPTINSDLAAKLMAGSSVLITDHVKGGEWVAVSDGSDALGYIKTSVLVANSD